MSVAETRSCRYVHPQTGKRLYTESKRNTQRKTSVNDVGHVNKAEHTNETDKQSCSCVVRFLDVERWSLYLLLKRTKLKVRSSSYVQ